MDSIGYINSYLRPIIITWTLIVQKQQLHNLDDTMKYLLAAVVVGLVGWAVVDAVPAVARPYGQQNLYHYGAGFPYKYSGFPYNYNGFPYNKGFPYNYGTHAAANDGSYAYHGKYGGECFNT